MYVTLNISTTSIRLLSVKGNQVSKWGEAPLAPGLVRDGLVLQPRETGKAINALFGEVKVPKKRVITCLSGLPYTYRFLNLPRLKPALQEEAVRRAARKEIPLPPEGLYLTWQPVITGADEQDFFVVAMARHLIDALIETLSVASLEPYLMDLKPLALARVANRGEAIVVSLEPDGFDIVLVVKGLPVTMYTISPRWEGATPEESTRQLVDELSKTVSFHNNNHPEEPVGPATPLLLTGELSSGEDTAKLIQDESGYIVAPLVPPLEFPADLPVASYATNIGLALKKTQPRTAKERSTTSFHDINVNMLSGKHREARAQAVSLKRVISWLALTVAVVLIFPGHQFLNQIKAETTHLRVELSRIDQEIYQSVLAGEKAEQMEITIRELTDRAETIEQEHRDILALRGDFTRDLRLVTRALPPQTYFTAIEMEKEQLKVQGETDSLSRVISYALALEAPARFSEVRIMEINKRAGTAVEETEGATIEEGSHAITFNIVMTK